jgi:hypothetical protein
LPLPTTPGTQPITVSTAPNIPQLPWTPSAARVEANHEEPDFLAEPASADAAPKPKRTHAKGRPQHGHRRH